MYRVIADPLVVGWILPCMVSVSGLISQACFDWPC